MSTSSSPPPSHEASKNVAAHSKSATVAARPSIVDRLPAWIATNLRSPSSQKRWLRCWIASWVSFVIILPNKFLETLGQAAFFALLASTMIPPYLPVQIFAFVIPVQMLSTMIIGVLVGWGFGCAAMRAALASRSQILLQASLQKATESAVGRANPDEVFEESIFAGTFLDIRSTAVFGCFLGLAVFMFALVRAYAPRLTLMSVFGTIAIDIFCSYGPLFPFAEYTLMEIVLIPLSCYTALGLILIVSVFPETLNHAFLKLMTDLIAKMKGVIDMQEEVLSAAPEDLAPGKPLYIKVTAGTEGIIQLMQLLHAQLNFVDVEFSWGKWNGSDLKTLSTPLQGIMSRIAGLQIFAKLAGHPHVASPSAQAEPSGGDTPTEPFSSDSHVVRQMHAHFQAAEATHSVRMSDVLPLLRAATKELRAACSTTMGALLAVVENVNTRRYSAHPDAEAAKALRDLDTRTEELRRAMDAFKAGERLLLVAPFAAIVDAARSIRDVPLRTLYVSYVFSAMLMVVAGALVGFSEAVALLAQRRTRNRLWAPAGLRTVWKLLTSRDETEGEPVTGESPSPEEHGANDRDERTYKRDPDSRPPTNRAQRFMSSLHSIYQWCKTPEAMFGFKSVVITIALWLPSVLNHTAKFVYSEKGVWALIMAQTTLNVYASDQIYNAVLRLSGTFIGGVYGLLCWYIGSAKSNGNVYGSAASVAVFLVPLTFLRLYAPPQYLPGVLLGGATFTLVVGYSWIDGHLPVFGNVGLGWSVAWRRFVLVSIGCVASFILMMFPPSSGRKAVRLRNATTITEVASLYSHLMAAWINEAEPVEADPGKRDLLSSADWLPEFRTRLLALAVQLRALRTQIDVARWEGNVRGAWPVDEYERLGRVQSEMVASLALLGGALAQLDRGMRISLLQHTRFVNPNFISDVMATFLLVAQSLRTGEPLHQAQSQDLLEKLHYHSQVVSLSFVEGVQSKPELLQSVTQYEYMFFASAVVAVLQLVGGLNELRSIAARLCGEVTLEGLEQWKEKYERARARV